MTTGSPEQLDVVSPELVLADPSGWRETLLAQHSTLGDKRPDEQARIIRSFLTACLATGPGSVNRREARNILTTILFVAKSKYLNVSTIPALSELLDQVLRREDLDSKWEEISELRRFLLDGPPNSKSTNKGKSRATRGTPIAGTELPRDLASLIDSSTEDEESTLQELSRRWMQRRREDIDPITRIDIDLYLLRRAIVTRSSIAVEFVHELFMSDDFWNSEMVRDWCSNIGTPVAPDGVGAVCAAMVNSRLRTITPRTFLKHPEALVIDAIARGDETKQIEDGLRKEFALQLLLALVRIDEALTPERPVKKPLQEIRKSFENTLLRYSMKLIGDVGSIVPYDPEIHLSAHPIVKGENVVVVECGLKSFDSGHVIQSIKVLPIDNRTEEKAK